MGLLWRLSPTLVWPSPSPAFYSPSSSSSHSGQPRPLLKPLRLYCMPLFSLSLIHTHTHRKKLFTAVHNFVHLNLAISLFIGYLIFAVGVELGRNNKVGACPLLWGGVSTAVVPLIIITIMCWALTRILYRQDLSGGPLLAATVLPRCYAPPFCNQLR